MKILRTIILVLLAIAFLIFAIYNWEPVELALWQNLVLETKVPMLVLLAFLAGFVPMWALHRSVVWNQNRRIRALETSLKNSALSHRSDGTVVSNTAFASDSPVEKSGKTGGDTGDSFASHDAGDTGDGGSGDGGGGE